MQPSYQSIQNKLHKIIQHYLSEKLGKKVTCVFDENLIKGGDVINIHGVEIIYKSDPKSFVCWINY